ncbi:hypothetical protein Acr_17g0000100 [Actinidia rufa]|uniref:Uncharacterized protein n=1 Tax=Actinidia rufa TaxID=165716 RepID=A0A7J0G155_9ERIC|nr:hypothetical protein Acr_17g0000100 [Actinidia rufa]
MYGDGDDLFKRLGVIGFPGVYQGELFHFISEYSVSSPVFCNCYWGGRTDEVEVIALILPKVGRPRMAFLSNPIFILSNAEMNKISAELPLSIKILWTLKLATTVETTRASSWGKCTPLKSSLLKLKTILGNCVRGPGGSQYLFLFLFWGSVLNFGLTNSSCLISESTWRNRGVEWRSPRIRLFPLMIILSLSPSFGFGHSSAAIYCRLCSGVRTKVSGTFLERESNSGPAHEIGDEESAEIAKGIDGPRRQFSKPRSGRSLQSGGERFAHNLVRATLERHQTFVRVQVVHRICLYFINPELVTGAPAPALIASSRASKSRIFCEVDLSRALMWSPLRGLLPLPDLIRVARSLDVRDECHIVISRWRPSRSGAWAGLAIGWDLLPGGTGAWSGATCADEHNKGRGEAAQNPPAWRSDQGMTADGVMSRVRGSRRDPRKDEYGKISRRCRRHNWKDCHLESIPLEMEILSTLPRPMARGGSTLALASSVEITWRGSMDSFYLGQEGSEISNLWGGHGRPALRWRRVCPGRWRFYPISKGKLHKSPMRFLLKPLQNRRIGNYTGIPCQTLSVNRVSLMA